MPGPATVEIELDRKRELRLTAKDLFLIERRCGISLTQLLSSDRQVGQTLTVLEFALRHEDPSLDEDRVLELVDQAPQASPLERYNYIEERVARVMASCFPSAARRATEEIIDRGLAKQKAQQENLLNGTGESSSESVIG